MNTTRLTKLGLHIWIGITTVIGFLVGWMLLAHSGKPAPLVAASAQAQSSQSSQTSVSAPAAMPTLAPIPSLDQLTAGAQLQAPQPLPAMPQIVFGGGGGRMRTSGS